MYKKRVGKKEQIAMSKDSPLHIQESDQEVEKPAAAKPLQLELDDLRTLQLVYKEAENALLKHRLAQMELDNSAKVVELAKTELSKLNTAVNTKYKLDPAKDRINLADGKISRE